MNTEDWCLKVTNDWDGVVAKALDDVVGALLTLTPEKVCARIRRGAIEHKGEPFDPKKELLEEVMDCIAYSSHE